MDLHRILALLHKASQVVVARGRELLVLALRAALYLLVALGRAVLFLWNLAALRSVVRATALGLALAGAALAFGALCLERIRPGEIGVREAAFGPGAGIERRDHEPGLKVGFPWRDRWSRLPTATHFVRFGWESEGGNEPMLQVATRQGEPIDVAANVAYRIAPGRGWRIVAAGVKDRYHKRAAAIVRRVLLEELARLTSEDFADPVQRERTVEVAMGRLRTELDEIDLVPLAVLVGTTFFHPSVEMKMLEKQLALQGALTERSLAARRAKQLEKVRTEHELATSVRRIQGRTDLLRDQQRIALELEIGEVQQRSAEYDKRQRMEADGVYERLIAQGELALAEAEAHGKRLQGEALEGAGGRIHLALEAARNLRYGSVTLDSSDPSVPSPLDLDRLVQLLVGSTPP